MRPSMGLRRSVDRLACSCLAGLRDYPSSTSRLAKERRRRNISVLDAADVVGDVDDPPL